MFPIAWGDVDALAEAGFCYAQGIGCKKNLRKSAKFYRMAEAKGMSMVGNSWYVQFAVLCLAPSSLPPLSIFYRRWLTRGTIQDSQGKIHG